MAARFYFDQTQLQDTTALRRGAKLKQPSLAIVLNEVFRENWKKFLAAGVIFMDRPSDDWLRILRHEFDADEGSFLIQLQCNLVWDKVAFSRLLVVMESCCKAMAEEAVLERWMAHGFWFVPDFVKSWTTHPDFPQKYSNEYFQKANERLDDLAFWFFVGERAIT